jgi:hypothetical protein
MPGSPSQTTVCEPMVVGIMLVVPIVVANVGAAKPDIIVGASAGAANAFLGLDGRQADIGAANAFLGLDGRQADIGAANAFIGLDVSAGAANAFLGGVDWMAGAVMVRVCIAGVC